MKGRACLCMRVCVCFSNIQTVFFLIGGVFLTFFRHSEEFAGKRMKKEITNITIRAMKIRRHHCALLVRGGAVEGEAQFGSCYTLLVPWLILPFCSPMAFLPTETTS